MSKIVDAIREQRELKGLSLYKLAKNTGLPIQTLIKIECNGNPTIKTVETILKHLGGSLEVKWDGE